MLFFPKVSRGTGVWQAARLLSLCVAVLFRTWLLCWQNNVRTVGLSPHQHEHYVDVAWRNAWYATCLRHRFRVNLFKLLPSFR